MRRLPSIAVVGWAVMLGACGGNGDDSTTAAAERATTTTSSVAAAGGGTGGASDPGASRGSGSASGGAAGQAGGGQGAAAGGTAAASSKPPLELGVKLQNACVRPGTSQTITITAPPESAVGYDAVYADGKSGLVPGHYGGNKAGHTDGTSTWADTWVVAPNAPAGPVRVDSVGVSRDGRTGQRQDSFKVSDATGRCA